MIKSMQRRHRHSVLLCLLILANYASPLAAEENPAMSSMEHLGDQRYRIGNIDIDRSENTFTVAGKILHVNDALEYLAISLNGSKEYESLLELSTSPREFNLACILIGFDEKHSKKPRYQFDEQKPQGQAVKIELTWEVDGEVKEISGSNAMLAGEKTFDDDGWIYIGSTTSEDGQQFMAEMGGTLIGFVHDPYSVIDHISGGGIGAYGLITGNNAVLPPEGSAITLRITLISE